MLAAVFTKLLQLQLLRSINFIALSNVVKLAAFCTLQTHNDSRTFFLRHNSQLKTSNLQILPDFSHHFHNK